MYFKVDIPSEDLGQLDPDRQLSNLLKSRVGRTQTLKEEKGRLNVCQAHVHIELSQLPQGVLLEEGCQHLLGVVDLVVGAAEQVDRVGVGDRGYEQLLQVGCVGPQPLEGCPCEVETNAELSQLGQVHLTWFVG